ncbi:TPA: single-stranded-DNA-specific exonuclease RecJ [Aeromonas veronii]|nr:single-stranded-DNA-specific exonuclease RecJ [Aeromonas veronii]
MRYKRRRLINKQEFSSNDLINRVLNGRNIKKPSELDYALSNLLPYDGMKDIDKAAVLIADAVINKGHVVIVGDYDCDGATSTAVAMKGLQLLGANAENVSFMVPDRFTLGYGLTPPIIDIIRPRNPNLIITVDNGISSIEGAKAAKTIENCKLLITDHHLPPNTLPEADAVVDPNRADCPFRSKYLAGCGVMFYTLMAARDELFNRGYYSKDGKKPPLGELLDLVALGTVADMVTLDYNNRILVNAGIERIRRGHVRAGIACLLKKSDIDLRKTKAEDFGFKVGPKINAAGRLKDMSIGIKCLITDSFREAEQYANVLGDLNVVRKKMQSNMAYKAITSLGKLADVKERGICVYDPEYHEGVVGLIASKIKEDCFRPAVVFTDVHGGEGLIKGSGRSTGQVRLRDVLDRIQDKHGLLVKYGGHDMAAGMTIKKEDFEKFKKIFNEEVSVDLKRIDMVIEHDGPMMPNEFNLLSAVELDKFGPWGQGFQSPVFCNTFQIRETRSVGPRQNHLRMVVSPVDPVTKEISDKKLIAMAFNQLDNPESPTFKVGQLVQSVHAPLINEYNGEVTMNLVFHNVIDYGEFTKKNEKNIEREHKSLGLEM